MAFFDPEHKTKAHILELIFIIGAMGLSVGRIILAEMPMTRADTIALAMGGKSLIIIGYQLLTEHVRKFARFHSRKANFILNTLEIAFWGAVIYFSQMSIGAMCPLNKSLSTSCIFGWTIIALAAFISVMSLYAAILSFMELRLPKPSAEDRKFENLADTFDDAQPLRPVHPVVYPHTEYSNQYHNQHNNQQYAQYPSRQQKY